MIPEKLTVTFEVPKPALRFHSDVFDTAPVRLVRGDGLSLLASMESESIGVAVTDPASRHLRVWPVAKRLARPIKLFTLCQVLVRQAEVLYRIGRTVLISTDSIGSGPLQPCSFRQVLYPP